MSTPVRAPFRLVWRILGGLVVLGGGGYLGRHRLHRWFAGGGPQPGSVWGEQDDADFQPRIQEEGLTPEAAPNLGRLLDSFRIKLTAQQKAFLAANHFVLLPREGTTLAATANRDELLDAFDRVGGDANILNRSPENAKLVTPDLVLHAFNKFFGMTLEQLERGELRRDLRHFLEGLLEVAAEAQKQAPADAPAYERIRAQMAVALVLLESCGPLPPPFFESPEAEKSYTELDETLDSYDNAADRLLQLLPEVPEATFDLALKELSLICEAESAEPSPLFGQYDPETRTDYTQFTPRSYYARCSALRAYFRAMIYLGRAGYGLKSDAGLGDAVLLAGLFSRKDAAGKPPADAWQRMMDITTLYAGPSDDLTYTEWRGFLEDIAGSGAPALDPGLLARLRQNEGRLRRPRILSDPARDRKAAAVDPDLRLGSRSFRVFGQRFSYDAWVLNRLNAESNLPATALYLPGCLGDRRAQAHAQAFVRSHPGPVPMSDAAVAAAMDQLGQALAKEPAAQWEASLSAGWLEVLGTLTHDYGAGYPRYMQSQPFGDKQIQTFLGSYTELKHNTLLYAKQSYDEMGEGGDGPIPPVVKGFVEPNLAFWNRFSALVLRTRARFERDGLFPPGAVLERLKEFSRDTEFYRKFALRELKGEPISDEDYETLRVKGLSYMAEPLSGPDQITEETGKVAVVADVLTDGWAGTVLYEGTGRPYLMLALVGNEKSPRLTAGLAFNHYEFTEPLGTRTTDEGWKPRVYAGSPRPPAKNVWYQSLGVR